MLFLILLFTLLPALGLAQFQFFEQMFNPPGGGGGGGHSQPQNAGSDSAWYQQQYSNTRCDKYLCPHTLSCVHFPHHCPCAFPAVEEKFELGEGSMVCVSKGGFGEGETGRKIELARKGVL